MISTTNSHVSRAKAFFQKPNLFFAIAKSTPWNGDDYSPPIPNEDAENLDGVIGYKKVETIQFVVPVALGTGDFDYRDNGWKIVTADQAYTQKAKYVYLDTTIRYDELPLGKYRQVGLYSEIVLASGVSPGKTALLPSDVAGGILEALENRKPSERYNDTKEKLTLVIEF